MPRPPIRLRRPTKRYRERALARLPELARPEADYGLPDGDTLERLSQPPAVAPIGGRLVPIPTSERPPMPAGHSCDQNLENAGM